MTSERIKKILWDSLNNNSILFDSTIDEAEHALKSACTSIDREQRMLDRIAYLKYKENPTEAEKIEYEALWALM